ncbi:hypothetical protein A2955_00185 [Candidatus Woesebacteria bacterium RIFCSPLOWO2_01_FULL_37_19]|uniref:Sortase n=1 Tax=Candidatus Woesebacteria bacterium RIFCSPLOWO2_01_FULL_37_19 TaxID=1802514 RepID=A0A1F8B0Q9_9BACT|nr:MAG: hypothetical protein A2955_00185 [Candidatus Woesebacteria bacterium RIFCSPLOWO2_01_FULL_37_19]
MLSQKKIFKICALVMGISGFVILFSTIYPIFEYEWKASQKYPTLISPLVEKETGSFTFSQTDYTQASNWFNDKQKKKSFAIGAASYYSLTVPKLKIENATVTIGGEDLAKSLIQYPGTALPGKTGNTVVFGHSILPQYFDPKNYLSIFSTLPTLKKGDEIYTYFDGISYRYEVDDIFEVSPKDIQVLEQNTNGSFITLITCTPPGHPLKPKRLIVRAKLIPVNADVNELKFADADSGN